MARINLLPWRAERRQQRQREFYSWLAMAALAGVALSLLVWLYYSAQISGQNGRNDFLRSEIARVDKDIEQIKELDKQKDRLLARKKVIEELQANRSQMVHLFDSLVRTIPDGVALTSLKQEGDVLTLEGRAQSNARVSDYMRNLEGSGWMTNPDLSIIEAKAMDGASAASSRPGHALPYVFTLKVKLANPTAEQEAETAAAADGTTPADGTAPAPAPASAPLEGQPAAPAPAAPASSEPAAPVETSTPAAGSKS